MVKGSWRGERVNVFLEGHGSILFPPQSILLLISLTLSQSVCLSLISHSLTLSLPMTISNSVLRENHFIPSKKIKGQFIQRILISDRHCQRKIKHSNDFSLLLARIHLYFKEKKWSTCFAKLKWFISIFQGEVTYTISSLQISSHVGFQNECDCSEVRAEHTTVKRHNIQLFIPLVCIFQSFLLISLSNLPEWDSF